MRTAEQWLDDYGDSHRNGDTVWRQFVNDVAKCRRAAGEDAVPVGALRLASGGASPSRRAALGRRVEDNPPHPQVSSDSGSA